MLTVVIPGLLPSDACIHSARFYALINQNSAPHAASKPVKFVGLIHLLKPYVQLLKRTPQTELPYWDNYEHWLAKTLFDYTPENHTTATKESAAETPASSSIPTLAFLLAAYDGLIRSSTPSSATTTAQNHSKHSTLPISWLCATPLEYKLALDHVVAVDLNRCPPSASETAELLQTLNTYYADQHLSFYAPNPLRWYVRGPIPTRFTSPQPRHLWGKSIQSHLSHGPDASFWHHLQNEVQMLLFAHPVNQNREAAGLPPVNSLWFWGNEQYPLAPAVEIPYSAVYTDEPTLTALAQHAGMAVQPLPETGLDLLAAPTSGHTLILLDQLLLPLAYDDPQTWREQLLALETNWLLPAAHRSQQVVRLILGNETQLVQLPSLNTKSGRFSHLLNYLLPRWMALNQATQFDLASFSQKLFPTNFSGGK